MQSPERKKQKTKGFEVLRSDYDASNSATIEHWKNPVVFSSPGKCTFFLGPHAKDGLIEIISRYEIVLGCVAWLTDFNILDALAKKKDVSVVVQKEDFLRPDKNESDSAGRWRKTLRTKYEAIPAMERDYLWRYGPGRAVLMRRTTEYADLDKCAIRCAGNYNSKKSPAFPRMHHKFAVFGKRYDAGDERHNPGFIKSNFFVEAVWMGSMNWSWTDSVDGAVFIEDPKIAELYYNEFLVVRSHSESLDWTSEWCKPEHDGFVGES